MKNLPQAKQPSNRVALYFRVSSEDQAERQTILTQQDRLRDYCRAHHLAIVAEYSDDGVSGTIPLADRPQGRELLAAAAAGRFAQVVVYKFDRLGRNSRGIADARDALRDSGVELLSIHEQIDTSTPVGEFVFGMFANLAQLDRAMIIQRMVDGRDRVAKTGKWTGGPVPFGYTLDAAGGLIPSSQRVAGLDDVTEADLARSVFERVAAGSSTVAEARRLNSLGVSTARRYSSGKTVTVAAQWGVSRINAMLKNPVYQGRHVLESRNGSIEREVPDLVDPATWAAAQAQLTKNRALSTRNAKTKYLLRGLVRCGTCGTGFVGTSATSGKSPTWRGAYYRCGGQLGAVSPDPAARCRAKRLPAKALEDAVWAACVAFIRNPGETLAEAQAQLRDRLEQSARLDGERRKLAKALGEKDAERERILVLFRRGRIPLDAADRQIAEINAEAGALRAQLDAHAAQAALADAFEGHLAQAGALLARLRDQADTIDRTDDWATKREVVEILVSSLRVETAGAGRAKTAEVTVNYRFAEPTAVAVITTNTPTDNSCITLTRVLAVA